MRVTNATRWACPLLLSLLSFGAHPLAAAASPSLVLADLEGVWVSAQELDGIAESRSVQGVALRQVEIAPARGQDFHGSLVLSDGRGRTWRAVKELEASGDSLRFTAGPPGKRAPETKEWVRFRARLGRDRTGRPASITFVDRSLSPGLLDIRLSRIGTSLAAHLTHLLLSGSYVDSAGARWEFSDAQQARWPDRRFPYELAVDVSEADCPFISTPDRSQPGGEQRWGYRWSADTLGLYAVVYDSKEAPIHCEPKPFATLRRVATP